jgi:hypothetical protein
MQSAAPAILASLWFVATCAGAGPASAPADPLEREATDVATRIEQALRRGDPSVLAAAIDDQAIIDKAIEGLNFSPAQREKVRGQPGEQARGLADRIIQQCKGGDIRLLRVRRRAGEWAALFRAVDVQGGLNYFDLHFSPDAGGRVRVSDLDILLAGEPVSAILRRGFIPLVAEQPGPPAVPLTDRDRDYLQHMDEIGEFHAHTQRGEAAAALAVYDKLPASLRQDKDLLRVRILNSLRLGPAGEPTYRDAAARYEQRYPGDPALLLLERTALIAAGRYDDVLRATNALDKWVGGDPFLDVDRARAYLGKGDVATAAKLVERVNDAEPALLDPYFLQLDLSLRRRDPDAAVRVLSRAERATGVRLDRLESVKRSDGFAAFARSDQYTDWLKRHGAPTSRP